MIRTLRPAIVLFALLSLITGVLYPLAVTGVAQAVFPHQANGSLLLDENGVASASALIGQDFSAGDPAESAKWFWGRPSATAPVPYTALNLEKATGSSGSNLAPTNPILLDNVRARIGALAQADRASGYDRPGGDGVPIDLVTASGSGLDPHISPAAAEYQVPRVAKARGLSEESVRRCVSDSTAPRALGVLGEPVVNVVRLNRSLTAASRP